MFEILDSISQQVVANQIFNIPARNALALKWLPLKTTKCSESWKRPLCSGKKDAFFTKSKFLELFSFGKLEWNWLKKRFAKPDTLFPANWMCLCSYVVILFQNWMVFETIHRPLFAESKQVNFPNNSPVSTNYNGAFCKVGSELVL